MLQRWTYNSHHVTMSAYNKYPQHTYGLHNYIHHVGLLRVSYNLFLFETAYIPSLLTWHML